MRIKQSVMEFNECFADLSWVTADILFRIRLFIKHIAQLHDNCSNVQTKNVKPQKILFTSIYLP